MRRLLVSLSVLLLTACSPEPLAGEAQGSAEPDPRIEVPPPPPFPPGIRSLMLVRSITVRYQPDPEAKKLGTVAAHTRVAWKGAERGPGCEGRWIEIEPRGWVCEAYLKPSIEPPRGVELPKLGEAEVVPGVYGKVIASGAEIYRLDAGGELVPARQIVGKATVRRRGARTFDGDDYWHIGGGEFLPADHVREHRPTQWSGVELGGEDDPDLPIGFALAAAGPRRPVTVWETPEGGARVGRLRVREVVSVEATARGPGGAAIAHRVGEDGWVRAADLRVAEETAPPPATHPGERWIDIDLERQILVAYEGDRAVFATLVSTGKRRTPTEAGVYRVWIKFSETDMTGQMAGEAPYSVATVPWTQYFAPDIALHTAYWHDRFGLPQSHGCVNLAPKDARFLYFWTAPDVPAGWSMAHGIRERPGSMVRVRSAEEPDPDFKGYARYVYEDRLGEG